MALLLALAGLREARSLPTGRDDQGAENSASVGSNPISVAENRSHGGRNRDQVGPNLDLGARNFESVAPHLDEVTANPMPVAPNPASVAANLTRVSRNPEPQAPNPALRARLVAFHFNHRLRGAAADGDEAFCRELCAGLGVEFRAGAAEWPAGSEISEAEAREARFGFFAETMRELEARALWLGHHRDDVVETMLLRLSRGSSARGLAAPRPVQCLADGSVRLRPLLGVTKAEIVAALRAAGVAWREDATNHGDAFFRNRLRGGVIPVWAAAAPVDLGAAVARSRELLEEDDDALEAWVDRVLPQPLGDALPLAQLRAVPVAITRRALRRWLLARGIGAELGRTAFEELLRAAREGRAWKASAGAGVFLEITDDALRGVAAAERESEVWSGAMLAGPGQLVLPDGARLRSELIVIDESLRQRICAGEFDHARTVFLAVESPPEFLIRHWRDGDRYRPLGAAQPVKLQDQFVNRRVARGLRRRLPVVCGPDGGIVWVPGLPPADERRVTSGTALAVQLTYLPANSLSASSTGHV
ncbi:MAG TPA: tRNA lysidine(34) synthetase TilS [Opitutaceae bacterium]|nr:tRNA lysidine(34) synthetase TilS [Opitutaceae bacterium]